MDVTEDIVKSLIEQQFGDMKKLPVRFLDSGADNNNYLLGNQYLVRLPKDKDAAALINNEIKWLPYLQNRLNIDIPVPHRVGEPTDTFLWNWTITPWFRGDTADISAIDNREISVVTDFLKTLHSYAPKDAPINPYRGVALTKKAADVQERINRLKTRTDLITNKITQLWETAINEPVPEYKTLIHGDLHPKNIITSNRKIKAVIDWGDITTGDPANDIAILWMLFNDKTAINNALKQYGASQSLINRSIGWAIFFGTLFLDTGLNTNPQYTNTGHQTLTTLNNLL
ncbi:MAG: phosphotransferase [Bacteroidales bacterium]|jgi:aminoglycoside phosphotransferase (APT) family kinase protein|nr:phosphotransferase [Bacteroidales bacterium]